MGWKVLNKLRSYETKIFARDEISLNYQQARSRYTGKLFFSYQERKVTLHTIFVRRRDLACRNVFLLTGITLPRMNRTGP